MKKITRYMTREEFYKEVVKTYKIHQVVIAVEELSELQKELCKALRGNPNHDNMTEEIADVEIMLEQMKIYFEIKEDEIEEMKKLKIERTIKRLELWQERKQLQE